jgi:cobalt-zinc-cadmium efflux system outer membrane protein
LEKHLQIEKIRAKIALSTNKIELDKAKQLLKSARKRLSATWGDKIAIFRNANGKLDTIISIPPLEKLYKLINESPDIIRWETEIKQHKAILTLENSRRFPDLILSGGLKRLNEIGVNAFTLFISIPIPIFNRNQGGIIEARYRLDKANQNKKFVEVKLHTELAIVHQELMTTLSEIMTLRRDVLPEAQNAYNTAMEGYRQGKFSYLDVLDAQRTLFEVKIQYIEALADYHKAVSELERLIGRSISSIDNKNGGNHEQ